MPTQDFKGTLNGWANDIKIGSFTVNTASMLLTLDAAPATAWEVGDTITGQTSGHTGVIISKVTDLTYVINKTIADPFHDGEVIGVTGVVEKLADQGTGYPTETLVTTKAITGVGFKPSNIIFIGTTTSVGEFSIGFDNASDNYCVFDYYNDTPNTYGVQVGKSIYIFEAAGRSFSGKVSFLDSNGFTMTFTKAGENAGVLNVYYLAFR